MTSKLVGLTLTGLSGDAGNKFCFEESCVTYTTTSNETRELPEEVETTVASVFYHKTAMPFPVYRALMEFCYIDCQVLNGTRPQDMLMEVMRFPSEDESAGSAVLRSTPDPENSSAASTGRKSNHGRKQGKPNWSLGECRHLISLFEILKPAELVKDKGWEPIAKKMKESGYDRDASACRKQFDKVHSGKPQARLGNDQDKADLVESARAAMLNVAHEHYPAVVAATKRAASGGAGVSISSEDLNARPLKKTKNPRKNKSKNKDKELQNALLKALTKLGEDADNNQDAGDVAINTRLTRLEQSFHSVTKQNDQILDILNKKEAE